MFQVVYNSFYERRRLDHQRSSHLPTFPTLPTLPTNRLSTGLDPGKLALKPVFANHNTTAAPRGSKLYSTLAMTPGHKRFCNLPRGTLDFQQPVRQLVNSTHTFVWKGLGVIGRNNCTSRMVTRDFNRVPARYCSVRLVYQSRASGVCHSETEV